jgi:hypothetical protein
MRAQEQQRALQLRCSLARDPIEQNFQFQMSWRRLPSRAIFNENVNNLDFGVAD